MIEWTISTELFSLILLFLLLLNFHERRWQAFPQRRLYRLSLYLSAGSVVLNIACTHMLSQPEQVPLWVHQACNSAYFLLIAAVCSIIAYYMCRLIYEHSSRNEGTRRYLVFLSVLYALFSMLVLYNLQSGVMFYFDAELNYRRGPLVNVGYLVMLLQLVVLVALALINRRSLSPAMRRVMRILPPIVLALAAYQFLYPDVLLNGGIMAAANLILLINFQRRGIEQDILTCSGNRASLHQELALRMRSGRPFQIIAVSLSHFRAINQRYGAGRGDALLCGISSWLEQAHPKGKSFRTGSLDFALVAPYEGQPGADRLMKAVCARFESPWEIDHVDILPSAAFAEVIHTERGGSAEMILELLSFSLSLARSRSDHMMRYDPALSGRMAEQTRLIHTMQDAARENRFEAWYQPIYHTASGRFSMAEALVRMRDTRGQYLSPSAFIALAEANGLVEEITDAMLESVCALLADPAADSLEAVSVNLSVQQLLSNRLAEKLDSLLARYRFDPARLRLEVTERVLSENVPRMRAVMEDITRRGFSFALDDFGTGQSNLSLILATSFSCIKLDGSLLRDYPENERSVFVVHTMLDMFRSLECQLVVEGVETQAQADALIARGVEWIQGFYYARPMPRGELLRILRSPGAPSSGA